MTTVPSTAKTTAFFQLLNQTAELDSRDNRGKKHAIALVLTGLTCALCCGRDGSLSSLHRHMVNHFAVLCQATASTQPTAISRAQLPLVLAKVNLGIFAKLLFDWFAIDLTALAGCGLAVDGKDLRGSIQSGQTRTVRRCGDVVLSEDSFRTRKSGVSHLLSSLRTLTMNLLHRLKSKNMVAQLESFADKSSSLIQFMKVEAVL